jgi:HSP20 family protein
MTLVRLQPLRNISSLHREMDRFLDNLVAHREELVSNGFTPAAEIDSDADNFYLQLEVPGLTPEEIDVQVSVYSVVIDGERQKQKNVQAQGVNQSEFRYGKFHRTINLPEKIQIDRVEAKYEHGILKLTLPKAEDEKTKTVRVLVGA